MKNRKVYAPPGMETKRERRYYVLLLLVAMLIACFFFQELEWALKALYTEYGGYRTYRQDVMMVEFYRLLNGNFLLFGVVILYCVGTMVFRFWYYYQGSKSIYLMRRLPDRSVLIRSCVETPLKRILLSLAVMAGMLLMFYLVYWIATPDQYLQPNQWQKLWRWMV